MTIVKIRLILLSGKGSNKDKSNDLPCSPTFLRVYFGRVATWERDPAV